MKKWNFDDIPSQIGKVAIVTGANSGIGFELTLGLIAKGIEVVMACRNMKKASLAKAELLKSFPNAKINLISIDTSSLSQVRSFADQVAKQYDQLHYLFNNAGIMMSPYQVTEDGFENQLATNYLGHFLLTGLLLPLLSATPGSRVITLSSLSYKWSTLDFSDFQAQKKYSKTKAYGQSKRACLMFAFELQRRLAKTGHRTVSLATHPGLCKTNLDRYYPALIRPLENLFLQPARNGALVALYASLDENLLGGEFIGPDGFKQIRGNPTIITADQYCHDLAISNRLWRESEKLTDFSYLLS